MRFASLERAGVDPARLAALGAAAATGAALGFRLLVGGVLGPPTVGVELVIAALALYMVVTAPRRVAEASARSQSREAVPLAAAAAACLGVTGSRAKTLLSLRSKDPEISGALESARRSVLLGVPVRDATRKAAARLASYSAANALRGVADQESGGLEESGEEDQGRSDAERLSNETKLPVFMTACFFTPILLVMYSVLSHVTGPQGLAELVLLEAVVLDVAFSLCAGGRGGRR
jgi:hypothetical protein